MLGDNIKRYRLANGLTQQELAEKLHVVRQTISKWEKNQSVPDAMLLKSISDCLGVSVADLLGEAMAEIPDIELPDKLSEINDILSAEIKKRKKILKIFAPIIIALIFVSVFSISIYFAYLNPIINYSISKPVKPSTESSIELVHLGWGTRFGLPMPPHIKDEIANFGVWMELLNDEIHNNYTSPIHITAEVYYRGKTTVFVFTGTVTKDGQQSDFYRELIFDRKIYPVK